MRVPSFAVFGLLLAITSRPSTLHAQAGVGRDTGRSMTITQRGIAATSHILASQTATGVLARGGSAVDAAIAANAVLGLVEPTMDGIGGDLFVLYWDAKAKEYVGLNGAGLSPKALTPAHLAAKGVKTMPTVGIDSVTVPGAVDGWAKMHARYGKLRWKDLFDDAIYYAEQGFPVTEIIREGWALPVNVAKLKTNPESVRVYLPNGLPPAISQLFRNPDLGRAYRLIAAGGRDAFYKGEIATAILATSRKLGGTMTAEDLAATSAEWVEPISTDYRGWRVLELPPSTQGIAALEMLNIMALKPATPLGPNSPAEVHKRIESMKLAYADLRKYTADPRTYTPPVQTLLSPEWAKQRAALIDPAAANCGVVAGKIKQGDTTYLTVVDRDGNMASWIESVAHVFGSGVTAKAWGSSCTTGAGVLPSTRPTPTSLLEASARSTPSFRPSWRRARSGSASGLWVARTSPWPTRNLSPTSWTTGWTPRPPSKPRASPSWMRQAATSRSSPASAWRPSSA